jgi:hypothetical protein
LPSAADSEHFYFGTNDLRAREECSFAAEQQKEGRACALVLRTTGERPTAAINADRAVAFVRPTDSVSLDPSEWLASRVAIAVASPAVNETNSTGDWLVRSSRSSERENSDPAGISGPAAY